MYSLVDLHCDTVVKAYENREPLLNNSLHLDLKRLLGYGTPVQIFAIWLNKKYLNAPYVETEKRIDFYHEQVQINKEIIGHVNCINDIENNKKSGKISGILSIEGGEALEGNIDNLYSFYNKGVRAITLTWNHQNELGCGAGVKKGGLSEFGFTTIKEMEKLNMLVDVSHLNDNGFWDVAKVSEKPFFASHSNSRRITNVKRNLTDAQMKAIAEKGGVIGLNLCPIFLTSNIHATIDNILSHIKKIIKVAGEDYISFGCDFDGIDNTPLDINGVEDMVKIFTAIEKKFGESVAAKITEENFLRYFTQWN